MQKKLIFVLAAVAFVAGIALGIANRKAPLTMNAGTLLQPARVIAPFELQSADVAALNNAALSGQWTLIFFGFTQCPDICPATLQLLSGVRAKLADQLSAETVPDILLITVDPARDTVEALDRYTRYFGEGIRGATGSSAAIESVATDLGIVYQRIALPGEGNYTMDHSGAVLLLNPDVRLQAVFSPPLKADAIRRDLDAVIKAAQ